MKADECVISKCFIGFIQTQLHVHVYINYIPLFLRQVMKVIGISPGSTRIWLSALSFFAASSPRLALVCVLVAMALGCRK